MIRGPAGCRNLRRWLLLRDLPSNEATLMLRSGNTATLQGAPNTRPEPTSGGNAPRPSQWMSRQEMREILDDIHEVASFRAIDEETLRPEEPSVPPTRASGRGWKREWPRGPEEGSSDATYKPLLGESCHSGTFNRSVSRTCPVDRLRAESSLSPLYH